MAPQRRLYWLAVTFNHRWTQIRLIVSSFPFLNDCLERSLQTTTFCSLFGTKERERPGVFKHEERWNRYI
jgi:hypothetical protein